MLRTSQVVKLVSRHALKAATAARLCPAATPAARLHGSCIAAAKAKKGKGGGVSAEPAVTPGDNLLELDMMLEDAQQKLEHIQQGLTEALANIRGGGMAPDMLDHVPVQAYGEPTPLADVAQVAVKSATMLIVTPYDPEVCAAQVSEAWLALLLAAQVVCLSSSPAHLLAHSPAPFSPAGQRH